MINRLVLDLSHHNLVNGFDIIRGAGIVGIIFKCTQGTTYTDPTYAPRVAAARKAGLLTGAYHFNTGDAAKAQLEHFLKRAAPDDKTLLALDWEANKGHDMSLSLAREFLTLLDEKVGRKAVLYSGNVAKEKLGNKTDTFFGSHRLWLCQYGPKPRVQKSWRRPWLWQYTDGTAGPQPWHVAGVSGLVDCNHFDGDAEQLAREWA
jgi:lysozyme